MKRKLLKVTLALMATVWVGGVQAQVAPDFGTEEVVNTETTWVFNGDIYTVSDTETKNISVNEKLYNRSATSGRGFKFSTLATPTELTFEDGYHVTVNKIATGTACSWDKTEAKSMTAGAAGDTYKNKMTPFFAFNVSVAGTCYAYVKAGIKSSNSSVKDFRINFGKADGSTEISNISSGNCSSNSLTQIKYTCTEAGVFFLGSTAAIDTPYEIYAIRFVPSDVKKTIYIGATGYATFGNNTGSHLDIPSGLTAYAAKPGTNSVTLTALEGIPQAAGVVLKGEPNTNYSFKASATTYSASNNYMKRVYADATLAQTEGDPVDHWNYILANDNGTPKFFLVDGTSTIAKDKAYLNSNKELTTAGSRGVSIVFADEATGIEAVTTQQGDGQWYNLQGQKVAQPAKGLFIKNGKKVIIK